MRRFISVVNLKRLIYVAYVLNTYVETIVERDWNSFVKGLLKAEIARRHLTYAQIVDKLAEIGVQETEANLRTKISRGGFSAGFFVQCLIAIGAYSIRLHEPE